MIYFFCKCKILILNNSINGKKTDILMIKNAVSVNFVKFDSSFYS